MNVLFALVADAANVAVHNKLNVLGQFDTVWSRDFPAAVTGVYVARIAWDLSDSGSRKLEMRFVDEDGVLLGPPLSGDLAVPPDTITQPLGTNLILGFELGFPRAGSYFVELYLDGKRECATPIHVAELATDA